MEGDSSSKQESKLKIAGCWSGFLDVDLDTWTVAMLREELGRKANCSPESIKIIVAGKILKEEEEEGKGSSICNADGKSKKCLRELGVKNNSRVMASKIQKEQVKALQEEVREAMSEDERARRLARIRESASYMAERNIDDSLEDGDYSIEMENLDGKKVKIGTDADQRAIMMGLMLHNNAKRLIKKGKYKESLDILAMAEESFSLCNPKITDMMDNVLILQVDTVWCYLMLGDISWLSMAGARLNKARKGIDQLYKKLHSKPRSLEDRHLERIMYLKLEILEGVVAYHSGNLEEARRSLTSALAKYNQFQVSDEALSLLISMGYKGRVSKRALVMSGQDIQEAVNYLIEDRAKKLRRIEEDIQREEELREQKTFGRTPSKNLVNMDVLKVMVSLGIERRVAAEALRRHENDLQTALDDVTNPDKSFKIQQHLMFQDGVKELVSMGFLRSKVIEAMKQAGSKEDALALLDSMAGEPQLSEAANPDLSVTDPQALETTPAATSSNNAEASTSHGIPYDRDLEMEDEITKGLSIDPAAEFDIEVTIEGEMIAEYIALLDSAEKQSSS